MTDILLDNSDRAGPLAPSEESARIGACEFFARVDAHTASACGTVMATGQRILVEDITASPIFGPSLPVLVAAGVRSVQSTPLFDRAGRLLGIFSTHYRTVHRFDDGELRWLDLLARHAADVIERQRGEELLVQSQRDLEQRVGDRTRWLTLMHDVARSINGAVTGDEALRQVLHRVCEAEHWQIGYGNIADASNTCPCRAGEKAREGHVWMGLSSAAWAQCRRREIGSGSVALRPRGGRHASLGP